MFFLEGGYDLKALGESVADTFRALLGKVRMQRPPCLMHGVTTGACSAASRDTMVLHTLWNSFCDAEFLTMAQRSITAAGLGGYVQCRLVAG